MFHNHPRHPQTQGKKLIDTLNTDNTDAADYYGADAPNATENEAGLTDSKNPNKH